MNQTNTATPEALANKKTKDSFFTKLFSEPDKILSLYNAISNSHYPLDTPIEITTLEDVFFKGRYNDLSFVIDKKLVVLIEHQSSISPNMPIRMLIYLSRVYDKIVKGKDVYASSQIKLPRPEFIVLYNGSDTRPPEEFLKLSDLFYVLPEEYKPSGDLELTVRVLNINKGYNETLIKESVELSGYVAIVDEIRKNKGAGMTLEEATAKAVKDCAGQKILLDFLEKYGSEVLNMLNHEFDVTEYGMWRWEEGKAEGKIEGLLEGILKTAKSFLQKGFKPEDIADCTGLSLEQIQQLQSQ